MSIGDGSVCGRLENRGLAPEYGAAGGRTVREIAASRSVAVPCVGAGFTEWWLFGGVVGRGAVR